MGFALGVMDGICMVQLFENGSGVLIPGGDIFATWMILLVGGTFMHDWVICENTC